MEIGKYLKAIGENLIKIAEEMETSETREIPSGENVKSSDAVNTPVSAMIAESKENKASDEETQSKTPSKADVRKLLSKKSAQGFKEDVAKLLKKFGEGNLSSVPEEKYTALMAAAEEIGKEDGKDDEKEKDAGKEDSDA